MASFKDKKKRVWKIKINIGVAKRVKEETGVDLLSVLTDPKKAAKKMAKLSKNVEKLGQVVYSACIPPEGVPKDELENVLTGDVVLDSFNALDQALIDFFPSRARDAINQAKAKQREIAEEVQDEQMKLLPEKLESQEFREMVVNSLLGNPSTESQDNSKSTQSPLLSES